MSNDNVVAQQLAIVRCFELWAKISMMIVDGKRDATSVAGVLQGLISQSSTKPVFDPATFVGEGWSYAEPRNKRSFILDLLEDYSKVNLSTDWLQGRQTIDGETRRKHILANDKHIPLNAEHFLDLWNNKEKIPEEWKKVMGVITFDGDVLRCVGGGRCVLCMFWQGGWCWNCDLLHNEWDAYCLSAVVAS